MISREPDHIPLCGGDGGLGKDKDISVSESSADLLRSSNDPFGDRVPLTDNPVGSPITENVVFISASPCAGRS